MSFAPDYYDSAAGVLRLLDEHYGMPDQLLPIQREALRLCGPKSAVVDEVMRRVDLPHRRRALDLGCAVGGSVFALRRYFDQAVGVDRSTTMLAQARSLQTTRQTSVMWQQEGRAPQSCFVQLPQRDVTDGIEFREADVLDLPADLGEFDLVITEKVPECLPEPQRVLAQLPRIVASGGYFLHVSSYRWTDAFTARENLFGTPAQVPAQLDALIGPAFVRRDRFNTTFLLEADTTWFCFGIAEALLWQRV